MIAFALPGSGKTVAAGVVVLVVLYLVLFVFVSEEERIRRVISSTVAGYNSPDVGDAIAGLSDDFKFQTSKGRTLANKAEIRGYLAAQVLQSRDPATNRYNLRIDVEEDSIKILFDDEAKTKATVEFTATGSRTRRDKVDTWTSSFTVRVEKGADGWQAKIARLGPNSPRPVF